MKIDIRDGIPETLALELVLDVVRKGRVSQGEQGKKYYCWSFYTGNKRVLAWYPVSGFEPYKEETK